MPIDLFSEETKKPRDLFADDESQKKSIGFWDSLKSMPVITEPGTDMVPTEKAVKSLSGSIAPYSPEVGMVAGSAGGPIGVALGYLMGKQAQPLMESYAKDKPLPTGSDMTMKAASDLIPAAELAMMGPITNKIIGSTIEYLGPKFGSAAERLYSSSIKMPLSRKWTMARGKEGTTLVKEATREGLEREVPPSQFGIEKIGSTKRELGKEIGQLVEDIGPGQVSTDEILKNGISKAVERARYGDAPEKEIEAIIKWAENFRKGRAGTLTAKEMQKIKVELYNRINFDKTSGTADALTETLRKGLAHELRLSLEKMSPALKEVNREYGAAVNLEEALERAIPRMNNRDVFNLGTKVLLGRESWPLAILNQTLGHPQIKARLAFSLYKTSKGMMGTPSYLGGETQVMGLANEALPAPATQMGMQKQLGRGSLTLEEQYPRKLLESPGYVKPEEVIRPPSPLSRDQYGPIKSTYRIGDYEGEIQIQKGSKPFLTIPKRIARKSGTEIKDIINQFRRTKGLPPID
jgi:hypothetical protein